MTVKLTLTIEDKVITSAKKYARLHSKSLSAMVENYLKSVSMPEDHNKQLSPKVAQMLGSIKLPEDFDYKKELTESLDKKYR